MKNTILLCLILGNYITAFTQITPTITARVDTSNVNVKEVYTLYKNYINANPGTAYSNPYWNQSEVEYYTGIMPIDRSSIYFLL